MTSAKGGQFETSSIDHQTARYPLIKPITIMANQTDASNNSCFQTHISAASHSSTFSRRKASNYEHLDFACRKCKRHLRLQFLTPRQLSSPKCKGKPAIAKWGCNRRPSSTVIHSDTISRERVRRPPSPGFFKSSAESYFRSTISATQSALAFTLQRPPSPAAYNAAVSSWNYGVRSSALL